MKYPHQQALDLYRAEPHQFITEKQAARHLALSISLLQKQRHLQQGPPYYKIGRAVRYYLPDLIAFAESHRIEPRSSAPCQKSPQGV